MQILVFGGRWSCLPFPKGEFSDSTLEEKLHGVSNIPLSAHDPIWSGYMCHGVTWGLKTSHHLQLLSILTPRPPSLDNGRGDPKQQASYSHIEISPSPAPGQAGTHLLYPGFCGTWQAPQSPRTLQTPAFYFAPVHWDKTVEQGGWGLILFTTWKYTAPSAKR